MNLGIKMKDFSIFYELPLTSVGAKVRIKERDTFTNYAMPIAPTKTKINIKHYIEWQIGYDEVVSKDDFHFVGANEKPKKLYELSEIVRQFYQNEVIEKNTLIALKSQIEQNNELIENEMNIARTHFMPKRLANMNFSESQVAYPLLVHRFHQRDFLSEIVIREKQRAVGVMAMLYFCFPVSLLKNSNKEQNFLNRYINSKEKGYLQIDKSNIGVFLTILQIFGILSQSHKHDVLEILKFIINKEQK